LQDIFLSFFHLEQKQPSIEGRNGISNDFILQFNGLVWPFTFFIGFYLFALKKEGGKYRLPRSF